ncbi:ATP-binding protein [Parasedimentitalea huanghaiensis]|uniref:histidine kinase n=1 Tax=Parasedimentitalea huanghaiensis TaxID=2682100 RepID=A0A6L6WSU0_9RHOB|nr:ATP-binding protein [Zongyanglinia huanghaiensis]MVO18602.1 response regulator [Zongyanglinia huanghaiensis]
MARPEYDHPITQLPDRVSRRRYEREKRARQEAEQLLEAKSRELYDANLALQKQAAGLEEAVAQRTAEFEAARNEAESANAAKSIFLATMSHEIRTPLNGVLGMATALADSDLTSEQEEILDLISDSGNLLLSVINDILDLSKVEAGMLEIENVPTSVCDFLDGMCAQFAPKVREKGLRFTVLYSGLLSAGGVWAKFDPNRLSQVLGNLLSNAIKFTTSGAVAFTAEAVHLENGNLQLNLIIRDTGIGVPEENSEKLFQPFTQADASITRKFGGTGLGLVIARDICRMMGGDITCLSAAGDGTEFTASIQMAPAKCPETTKGLQLAENETVLNQRRWRVLIAEDNKTNQLVLKHMLKRYDLELVIVADGAKVVSEWRSNGADLILMDVNMPVMDGLSATQTIRADELEGKHQPVPIVAISANAMVHQVSGYLEGGMTGHVAKPIRKAELIRAMALALSETATAPT